LISLIFKGFNEYDIKIIVVAVNNKKYGKQIAGAGRQEKHLPLAQFCVSH